MNTHFEDYLSQGKSNNYLLAESEGKYKAGEVAKMLTKKFKTKISAKELECFASEWHHAGVFKGYSGKLTGRKVKFFTEEQIEAITMEAIMTNREIEQKKVEEGKQVIKGFYYTWDHDYSGSYGKKRNHKVLAVYEGSKTKMPQNFTECSQVEFECAQLFVGRKYYGWDEPSKGEFTKVVKLAEIEGKKKIEETKLKAASALDVRTSIFKTI